MNRDVLFAGISWAGIIVLLAVVPWLLPITGGLPNTASMQGYDIHSAYILVAIWMIVTIVASWLGAGNIQSVEKPQQHLKTGATGRMIEVMVVAAAVAFFYWPAALSRFGPHVEDSYFLMTLWRVACGDIPYTDFEFLYGPAMIHLPAWWMSVTGFSMKSYYSILMLLQVSFFVSLIWILQRYINSAVSRYLVFLILLPFFLDVVFGLNWIAWRYFYAVFVILILAANPRSISAITLAGIVVGLGATYSYEYAVAALLSGLSILVAVAIQGRNGREFTSLIGLPIVSISVWIVAAYAITGNGFGHYLVSTAHIMSTASSLGLGQFAFGWTIHSLALFLVFAGVAVMVGSGVRRLGSSVLSTGDLQLTGAVVFAIVVLKIAFQRADHLHLIVPFVPLIFVLLINQSRDCFRSSPMLRQLILCAVVVVSVAHVIGQLPTGQWVVFGTARGWLHEITDRPVVGEFESRTVGTESERSEARSTTLKIAALLNGADLRERPVLFYGGIWSEAFRGGVCPVGYSFYDILYSDDRKPLIDTVHKNPDLLILMKDADYKRLFEGVASDSVPRKPDILRQIGRVVSSVHFTETRLENDIEYRMWQSRLGDELRDTFTIRERLQNIVILEKLN